MPRKQRKIIVLLTLFLFLLFIVFKLADQHSIARFYQRCMNACQNKGHKFEYCRQCCTYQKKQLLEQKESERKWFIYHCD